MSMYRKGILLQICTCLFLGCCLSGCTDAQNPDASSETENMETSSDAMTEPPAETETSKPEITISAEDAAVPILSIQTKVQSADVLDFVTKPVSSHVANSLASWTPGYRMPPAPYYEACTISLTDTDQSVLLDAVDAEVKVRGNWTTTYDKKPLRIRLTQKQNLLGLNDGTEARNWVLLAGYKDASMLRDKTALSIARELLAKDGLYAADAEFVEVFINQEYWGMYLLTEMQQVHAGRIDITEAESGYTGTDIGYLMEFDGYFENEDALHQFHVDYADNAPLIPFDGNGGSNASVCCLPKGQSDPKQDIGMTIKSDITSQEQHDFIASYVNHVYRILYAAAYQNEAYRFNADYTEIEQAADWTPREAIEAVINVQSLVDMYIISELTCDADIYWSSFFLDVDFGTENPPRLTFEAPWDFDSAMGNKDRCANGTGFYASNIIPDVNNTYQTVNPWLTVLMYEDWYQEMIQETWTAAYDAGIFERACAEIDTDTVQLQDAFARNNQRWNNIIDNSAFAKELSQNAAKCRTQAEAAAYLTDWLQSRVEFLNEQWHS